MDDTPPGLATVATVATGGPGQPTGPEGSNAGESTRAKTVRLPDGTIHEVQRGWNVLPDGRRLWLYPDGTWQVSAPNPPALQPAVDENAMVDGRRAGTQGFVRQASPIVPGHTLTTTHGAWSARRVDPLAAELIETAVSAVSWLEDPTYRPAVTSWARAEARCQLLAEWLDEHGVVDPESGEPRPALAEAGRQEKLALQLRQRLGLDPASRVQLEATLTSARQGQAALEDAIRRGQEAMERRQAGPGAPQDARNEPQGSDRPSGAQPPAGTPRGAQDATGVPR